MNKKTTIIIIAVLSVLFISVITISINKRKDYLDQYIGTKIIIKSDTIDIIDYNFWTGSLKLERGYNIAPQYADIKSIK